MVEERCVLAGFEHERVERFASSLKTVKYVQISQPTVFFPLQVSSSFLLQSSEMSLSFGPFFGFVEPWDTFGKGGGLGIFVVSPILSMHKKLPCPGGVYITPLKRNPM